MGHVNFRAEDFNRLAEEVASARLLNVVQEGSREYLHPWKAQPVIRNDPTDPYDRELLGRYRLRFVPGLINMASPWVTVPIEEASPETRQRLRDEKKSLSGPVDAYLDEGPQLELNWRIIGQGEHREEPIPAALQNVGAGRANARGDVQLLAATDIVLRIPRAASTTNAQITFASDSQSIDLSPVYLRPRSYDFRIVSLDKYRPWRPSQRTLVQVLQDPFNQAGTDDLLICTFYALRPRGESSALPNRLWRPFIRQVLHHNLCYWPAGFENARPTRPIRLFIALAAGVAQPVISAILGQQNSFTEALANLRSAQERSGYFMSI